MISLEIENQLIKQGVNPKLLDTLVSKAIKKESVYVSMTNVEYMKLAGLKDIEEARKRAITDFEILCKARISLEDKVLEDVAYYFMCPVDTVFIYKYGVNLVFGSNFYRDVICPLYKKELRR